MKINNVSFSHCWGYCLLLLWILVITPVMAQTNWVSRSSSTTNSLNYVAYGGGLFVANTGTSSVLTSPDGLTWTTRPTSATTILHSTVFGNGQCVAVGKYGTILTSPDAVSWTTQVSGVGSTSEASGIHLYGVAYGAGLFVVTGELGLILTSPNGINWTVRVGTQNTYAVDRIIYASGLFIATGNKGIIRTSSDGITWTTRSSGTTDYLLGITYGNGQYVAVGSKGAIITSPDGLNWTVRATPSDDGNGAGVAYGNGVYVAVRKGGQIRTSFDAINWRTQPPVTTNDLYEIAYNGSVFVATGVNGTIITSVNTPVAPKLVNKQATQSRPFSATITAFAGSNLVYSASALPAGLSFDATTRIISGTPSTTGISSVSITATNTLGSATASFFLTVSSAPILSQRVFLDERIMASKLLPLPNGDQLLIGRRYNNDNGWITRLDNEGNTRWNMNLGDRIVLYDAVETADGGAIIGGTYAGATSLPVSLTNGDLVLTDAVTSTVVDGVTYTNVLTGTVFQTAPTGSDWAKPSGMLAMKLTASGLIEWIRILGPGAGQAVCKADNGNVWLVGYSYGSNDNGDIQGHHDPPNGATSDIWVVKLSPSGTKLLSRFYGGTNSELPAPNFSQTVKATADGGLIMAVQTAGYVGPPDGDFTGSDSQGNIHMVLKILPDASIGWFRWLEYGIQGITQTSDGAYVGVGEQYAGSGRSVDAYVQKFTSSGDVAWVHNYGGSAEDRAHSVVATPNGGCVFMGQTNSNDGDVAGNHAPTYQNHWVVQLSTSGELIYQRPFGSTGSDVNAGSSSNIGISSRSDGTFALVGAIAEATGDVLTPEAVTATYWSTVWVATFFIPTGCTTGVASSRQTGDWAIPATWVCGRVPPTTSMVQIQPGHVVTISSTVQVKQLKLESGAGVLYNAVGRLVLDP